MMRQRVIDFVYVFIPTQNITDNPELGFIQIVLVTICYSDLPIYRCDRHLTKGTVVVGRILQTATERLLVST